MPLSRAGFPPSYDEQGEKKENGSKAGPFIRTFRPRKIWKARTKRKTDSLLSSDRQNAHRHNVVANVSSISCCDIRPKNTKYTIPMSIRADKKPAFALATLLPMAYTRKMHTRAASAEGRRAVH